ncbi:MAG: alpha-galactosidase [Terrimicrobiaceae bacterium]
MNSPFVICHDGLVLTFDFFQQNRLRFRGMLPEGMSPPVPLPALEAQESELDVALHCTGEERAAFHGLRLVGSSPGLRLEFEGLTETAHAHGKRVVFVHRDPVLQLKVESVYDFITGSPVLRRHVRVINEGDAPVGIEHLGSALLHHLDHLGSGPREDRLRIHLARSTWRAESQWHRYSPSQLGLEECGALSLAQVSSQGNCSSSAYLPMGMLEDISAGVIWFWQIEHNGSWHWEISDVAGALSLYAGGPDEEHHNAWKNLSPGESYQSATVAIGCARGGFDEAVAALTRYRRTACLAPHHDNQKCHVIFNDYMHCLGADPTIEKELPLIEAAARAGCEHYMIDAGWYSEIGEHWWPTVGAWQPSKSRFGKEGLKGLLDGIRARGLNPGLWLEIEAAGKDSPLRDKPDAWFFCRHGRRIVNNGRLQLDFRNPEVRAYSDAVVDRLIADFGAGYFKVDYNMTFQAGTDHDAESPGQGLLEHGRAYLKWMEGVRRRHPHVVFENCGSGGLRMDYATLSQYQIQSSSDQEDYRKNPAILVGALAAVLPEQLAVWSYPLAESDACQASFNMVNGMLCRIHLSGPLSDLTSEALRQVHRGLDIYKHHVRPTLSQAIPFFPLGMPHISDPRSPVAVGLRCEEQTWLAVWRLEGGDTVTIPNPPAGKAVLLYPCDLGISVRRTRAGMRVRFPHHHMAGLIRFQKNGAFPRQE